jgi:hypothetical protein
LPSSAPNRHPLPAGAAIESAEPTALFWPNRSVGIVQRVVRRTPRPTSRKSQARTLAIAAPRGVHRTANSRRRRRSCSPGRELRRRRDRPDRFATRIRIRPTTVSWRARLRSYETGGGHARRRSIHRAIAVNPAATARATASCEPNASARAPAPAAGLNRIRSAPCTATPRSAASGKECGVLGDSTSSLWRANALNGQADWSRRMAEPR